MSDTWTETVHEQLSEVSGVSEALVKRGGQASFRLSSVKHNFGEAEI